MDDMDLIPPNAKWVVEFGCGNGTAGAAFKRIQPECRFWGMESDKGKLAAARDKLDGVVWETSASVDLANYSLSDLDCILYHSQYLRGNGLLENLKKHKEFLAEAGQMIFCLDNTGSFDNIMRLAAGQQSGAETDWSLSSFLEGLSQIGLIVDKVLVHHLDAWQELERQPNVQQLLMDLQTYQQERQLSPVGNTSVEEYIIRVARQPVENKFTLVTMPSDPVCENIRIKIPDRFYQTLPGVNVVETSLTALEEKADLLRESDIVLLERQLFGSFDQGIAVMDRLISGNHLLLHEFDDCPAKWDGAYGVNEYIEFRGCHVVQTSTKALGQYFQQYNPNILVFENELYELPEERRWDTSSRNVTIFFGALNRQNDWQEIMPVLNELIVRYGKQLHFKVAADRPFFDSLQTMQKEYVGGEYNEGRFAPCELYTEALYASDIALLPLKDNLFNRMKSDLKFIEAAANGAVVLASPTVYQNSVRDGRTGFLYHDPREFREWLTLLVDNPVLRHETAYLAYRYVKENRLLAQHYEERVADYRELQAKLPDLERARQFRLSQIRR